MLPCFHYCTENKCSQCGAFDQLTTMSTQLPHRYEQVLSGRDHLVEAAGELTSERRKRGKGPEGGAFHFQDVMTAGCLLLLVDPVSEVRDGQRVKRLHDLYPDLAAVDSVDQPNAQSYDVYPDLAGT